MERTMIFSGVSRNCTGMLSYDPESVEGRRLRLPVARGFPTC